MSPAGLGNPYNNILEYGKHVATFDDDSNPHEVIETIMDHEFVIICIGSKNWS